MFKKILVTTALVAIIGVLVFGAVNSTLAKNSSENEYSGLGSYSQTSSEVTIAEDASAVVLQRQGNGSGWNTNEEILVESASAAYGQGNGGNGGTSGGNGSGASGILPPASSGELSAEETAALLYMREEEKLAHDVYVTLYAKWGLPVFQNISQSEQAHTDSVKQLLDRYGLSDPASSAVGVFTDPTLQALYTELVARGSQSVAEALKVGAAIEEIDILDLQGRLAKVDNTDIQQVFNNLLKGSYSHLQAFVSTLKTQTGETYQPQYLSAEVYQEILSMSKGQGGNSSGQRNGQGSGSAGGSGGGGRGGRP